MGSSLKYSQTRVLYVSPFANRLAANNAGLCLRQLSDLLLDKMTRISHDIFRCIFVHENFRIFIKISPKFVRKGPINNNPVLV